MGEARIFWLLLIPVWVYSLIFRNWLLATFDHKMAARAIPAPPHEKILGARLLQGKVNTFFAGSPTSAQGRGAPFWVRSGAKPAFLLLTILY